MLLPDLSYQGEHLADPQWAIFDLSSACGDIQSAE
jgi:hypothetical protein